VVKTDIPWLSHKVTPTSIILLYPLKGTYDTISVLARESNILHLSPGTLLKKQSLYIIRPRISKSIHFVHTFFTAPSHSHSLSTQVHTQTHFPRESEDLRCS